MRFIFPLAVSICILLQTAACAANTACAAPTKLANENYDVVQSRENLCLRKTINLPAEFHMLVFSWSPGFCKEKRDAGKLTDDLNFQCVEHDFKWVVHGLWAEVAKPDGCMVDPKKPTQLTPLHPRYCKGDLPKLDIDLVKRNMCTIPGASLIQGEWEKHGACSFATPDAYFEKIRELTTQLKLPDNMMPQSQLFNWMRRNNPVLRGVRLDYDAKHKELHVCYSTSWLPIDCPVMPLLVAASP